MFFVKIVAKKELFFYNQGRKRVGEPIMELNEKIEALKLVAKNKNITYEKLAELSEIPISTLKKIFSGKTTNPRLDTIQAIERALGLDEEPKNSVQIPDKYKDIMVALNDGDKNLQQEDIDAIVRFIEFTKNK